MTITERLLTPKQLAEIAGVSAATIKREVARGRLRAVRIGSQPLIRVPESAWDEYVARVSLVEDKNGADPARRPGRGPLPRGEGPR